MTRRLLPLLAALAVAGCGGDGDGDAPDPERVAGNGVDRAFVAGMVPHHESAIEMAEIARDRATTPFVKKLAADIIRTQEQEIATMRREDQALSEAGIEPGDLGVAEHEMGMHGDVASLRDAEPFDRAFLEMMIPHHEGALTMAQAELAKGADPDLERLAQAILDGQRREIDAMQERLSEPPADDGGGEEHGSHHGG